MHLTAANLAYFVMDRGLLGADEIVVGRFLARRREPTPSIDKKRWTLMTFGAKMPAP